MYVCACCVYNSYVHELCQCDNTAWVHAFLHNICLCVCVCVWTKSGNERNAHWNSILHQMLLCFIHEMFSLLHYIIASLIQMHILFVCIFFFSSLSLCRLQENIIRKSYFAPRTYIQHVFHRRCVVFSIRTATLISVWHFNTYAHLFLCCHCAPLRLREWINSIWMN